MSGQPKAEVVPIEGRGRRRLAVRAKKLGRQALAQVANVATPDTILRWYRRLIAAKYDGSRHRGRGRPRKPQEVVELVLRMAAPWKTFLRAQWEGLAAADLFTVEVLTPRGLKRYFVLFVIELKSRRVKIAGIHPRPCGKWMTQMARNLTDAVDGFLGGLRHLIHDRDPLFTREFSEILKSSGVAAVRLPPRSPNLNAFA